MLGNLVTISLLYKSLCAGCIFINKQFIGVHLWGVLCVELPPSTDRRGWPIAKGDTLCVCVQSTLWCYFCVCGPMPLSAYYGGVIFSNILEEHGCHFWFNSWWSLRVDPCSIYISLFILSIVCEFTVYLLTLMKLSIQYLCHQLITINLMIRNNSTMLLSLESLFFISISIYSPYYNYNISV